MIVTALALAASQAVAPAASLTLQQRFDAANAAQEAGRCTEAVPLYTALEAEPRLARNATAAAAIAVRKGICQLRIGQEDAGTAGIRRGLPVLEKAGTEFAVDVRRAHLALGETALQRFDVATATANSRSRSPVRPGSSVSAR
ncbi:hypothetical protein AB5I41_19750 [Sphingomonas sp. MMS24-JH45]